MGLRLIATEQRALGHQIPASHSNFGNTRASGVPTSHLNRFRFTPSSLPTIGRRNTKPIRIKKPNRSSLANGRASTAGIAASAIRLPSSGGIGSILKMAALPVDHRSDLVNPSPVSIEQPQSLAFPG